MAIKLVSADLNGTLVHQHTMSDMIKIYKSGENFKKAENIFKKQISGSATMKKAFDVAGPLSKGITLRQAIEYAQKHMRYLKGFEELLDFLYDKGIPLIINSTGYSVTFYCIQEEFGSDKIHGFIGNNLIFGVNGDQNRKISEKELKEKVGNFFSDANAPKNREYDKIKAIGKVEMEIVNEEAKADLVHQYINKHFKNISINEVAHIGDTMGDSEGIFGIAKSGGFGIAFNYNQELENFLKKKIETESVKGKIIFIDKKSKNADLRNIIPHIK